MNLREYATARQESGPVKTWAEMTAQERARVVRELRLKPGGAA